MTTNARRHAELTIDLVQHQWAELSLMKILTLSFDLLNLETSPKVNKFIVFVLDDLSWIDVINPPYFPSALHSGAARETL